MRPLFFEDQSNSIEYKVVDFVFVHCVLFCHFTVSEHCTKERLQLTFDLIGTKSVKIRF